MPSASGEQDEDAAETWSGWPNQRHIEALQEEERFVYDETNMGHEAAEAWSGWPDRRYIGEDRFFYDEMNTGHEDATESKKPDQNDLDQGYIE